MTDIERLRALIRYEVDSSEYTEAGEEQFGAHYAPDYHDLEAACENMIRAGAGPEDLEAWYICVFEELAQYYDGMDDEVPDNGWLWPGNDKEQFFYMKGELAELLDDDFFDTYVSGEEQCAEYLAEILQSVAFYEENRGKETADWELCASQKEKILTEYEESSEEVPPSRKELFRKIVDEGCENDHIKAMTIKGYGCYGGNSIFDCDWEESRKLIDRLFELTGEPSYANTLGYIYYYGRCSNGVPDYEKAFQYYSVGAAYDLFESTYKIADMFLAGKGCIRSPQTAWHIIDKIYWDSRQQFCSGEDAKFADIALRKASAMKEDEEYIKAVYHYLEADLAIKLRMKTDHFFGNQKVQDGITKGLEEMKEKLGKVFFTTRFSTERPYWLFEMVNCGEAVVFRIVDLGKGHYRITAERKEDDPAGKALIVAPALEQAGLTRSFSSEFVTQEEPVFRFEDRSNILIDHILDMEEEGISFRHGDTEIFLIKNARFFLKKEDFDS